MSLTNEAIIEHLIRGNDLDSVMVRTLMERILTNTMPDAQIAASLALLRAKSASPLEIAQSAETVLNKAMPIERPGYLFADVVGTGGDGFNTINVSTLASITAASLGLPVAKHGSVSVSSKCGSADVLKELGIDISMEAKKARSFLDQNHWCFLFAPIYHPSFLAVKKLRQELKIKTIFNILGPLVNPLSPPVMLIGVYDPSLITLFVQALRDLRRKRVLIVHGSGLDEIALHGPTTGALLDDKSIVDFHITPKDLGLKFHGINEIQGGMPQDNARIFQNILSGNADDAKTSMVAASAGVLLWLGEVAKSPYDGVTLARSALLDGMPARTLLKLRESRHGA